MRKPRIKVLTLYLSLFLHLLAGFGNAKGVVLCFETDGQVAVEYSRNGTCCPTVQVPSPAFSLVRTPSIEEHCGECLDIPILFIGTERPFILTQDSIAHIEPVFVLLSLLPSFTLEKVISEANLLQYSTPPNSTLISHRTVILLI